MRWIFSNQQDFTTAGGFWVARSGSFCGEPFDEG